MLAAGCAVLIAGCTSYSSARKISSTAALASTAEQRQLVHSQESLRGRPLEQLGGYLDAADAARRHLLSHPDDVLRQSDYNFAVARAMEIVSLQGLAPWDKDVVCPSATGAPWRLRVVSPFREAKYHPSQFHFTPSDRYTFHGSLINKRVYQQGLGAPLVVSSRGIDYTKRDRFAQGRQLFYGLTAILQTEGRSARIELFDPLNADEVRLGRHTFPLGADFQGPMAMAMAQLRPRRWELVSMFKPEALEDTARLARMQPYDPRKIPVIFIHGLSNSPATWAPLAEFLRGDPTIRRNFQSWVFAYPTGSPYPLHAAALREQLAEMRRQHPEMKDVILVGHSQGGMIARLLVSDSGSTMWDAYFDRPINQLDFTPPTRRFLEEVLLFKPVPGIGRVVFVGASHRGSYRAVDFWGRLGRRIIGDPVSERRIFREAYAQARPEARMQGHGHLPNSIELLNPDSVYLTNLAKVPVHRGVPFHSLMGDRGKGGFLDRTQPQMSDGIVPYWSSHLPGARSERIVPSGHWVHLHPLGMVEINRILLEHLQRR